MAALVTHTTKVFALEATTGTTDDFSPSPSGDDLFIFAGGSNANIGATPPITEARTGGSGGTDIPQVGTDGTYFIANASFAGFKRVPGPSGTSNLYFAAPSGLQIGIGGSVYSGADQTDGLGDYEEASGAEGDVDQTLVQLVISDTVLGQKVTAVIAAVSGDVNISAFTEVDEENPVISSQDVDEGVPFLAMATLNAEASGTSYTFQVYANSSAVSSVIAWYAGGGYVVDAAGGGAIDGELTATLGALTSAATAALEVQGILSGTLGAMTASGAAGLEVEGELTATLGAMTLAAEGTMANSAQADITLGALTSAATGTVSLSGTLDQALGEMLASGAGGLDVGGELTATLGAMTLEATGAAGGFGDLTATLGAMTLEATGELTGQPAQQLGGGGLAAQDIAEQERRNREAIARRAERLAQESRELARQALERQEALETRLNRPPQGRSPSKQLAGLLRSQVEQSRARVASYTETAAKAQGLAQQAQEMEARELRRALDELACMLLLQAVL